MAELRFRTSGSTGEPKTIARDTVQLDADAANLVRSFPCLREGRPRFLASIRSEHFFGALWRDRVPAAAGSSIDPAVILSVEELLGKTRGDGSFVFVTTPSFLEKALSHPDFPSLKGRFAAVVTSGSALRRETALETAETLGVCPLEIYGSTEAGTVAWRRMTEGREARLVDGVEASQDEEGRLVVRSPFAMENPLVMGDLVRFVSPRAFELLGRADRRVKVLEKFVSLTAVERAFEGHRHIAAARAETWGEGVERIGIVCTLTPEGAAALVRGTYSGFIAALRRDLVPATGTEAFPRRVRFVRELPVDGRGKTTKALVRATLAANCREPVVTRWRASGDLLEAGLVFPPDSECFEGHFPGYPLLPGVAQLYFMRYFARRNFADFPEACCYRRLKFRRMVRPGEEIALEVRRGKNGEFSFSMSVGGEIASSSEVTGVGG